MILILPFQLLCEEGGSDSLNLFDIKQLFLTNDTFLSHTQHTERERERESERERERASKGKEIVYFTPQVNFSDRSLMTTS